MSGISAFFIQTGPAGVALAFIAIYALYLALRTFFYLHSVWKGFKKGFLDKHCTDRKCIEEVCENSTNPLILIIDDIVQIHSGHSEDLRSEIAYLFHRNFEHISKSLSWLKVISAMSPLIGLLGTVLGMVSVFQGIAGDATNQAQLAGGIWEALLTTVFGLSVAIPTLFVYYYLALKFKAFHIEVVEHSYMALEICGVSHRHRCNRGR